MWFQVSSTELFFLFIYLKYLFFSNNFFSNNFFFKIISFFQRIRQNNSFFFRHATKSPTSPRNNDQQVDPSDLHAGGNCCLHDSANTLVHRRTDRVHNDNHGNVFLPGHNLFNHSMRHKINKRFERNTEEKLDPKKEHFNVFLGVEFWNVQRCDGRQRFVHNEQFISSRW